MTAPYGGINALSKLINDKKIRTKDVRALLEKDFPLDKLPTVEQARTEAAQHRKALDERRTEQFSDAKWEQLAHEQAERRTSIVHQLEKLKKQQGKENLRLHQKQSKEILIHKKNYLREQQAIRTKRTAARPTGLAEFLGRITGINLIRKKIHAYQDKKSHESYKKQRDKLHQDQRQHKTEQTHRHTLQRSDIDRKLRSLDKIDRRENTSLALTLLREERVRHRSEQDHMPPIRKQTTYEKAQVSQARTAKNTTYRGEPLGTAFIRAKCAKVPLALGLKLQEAFSTASDSGDKSDDGRSDATGTPKPPVCSEDEQYRQSRTRDKHNDRGR